MRTHKEELFRRLVEEYFSTTYTRFSWLCRSHPNVDASDLNQSFWIEFVYPKPAEVLKKIEERSPSYILVMVKNYFIDHLRKLQRPGQGFVELKEELIGGKKNPENRAIDQQMYEECEQDIKNIYHLLRRSDMNQAIFMMMLDKCKNAEIADTLGISKESVERRKCKIRDVVRKYLESKNR